MEQFEASYARWVVRHPWLIISVAIVLMAVAAAGARHLTFNSSYRVYFGPDNPQRIAFEALENTYVKNDSLLIVLAPGDRRVFTQENLAIVEEVTKAAWQIPYSNRVDSITNFQYTEAHSDTLVVRNLVVHPLSLSDEDLVRIKTAALAEPFLNGALIRPDAEVTGLFINVQPPGVNPTRETAEIIAYAKKIAANVEAKYPQFRVYLSGMVVMNNAFPEATKADYQTLIPLSFGVMTLLITVLVGGIAGTVAAVIVFACSIAGAIGLAGYIGYPLTPASASAPTIILTVAMANCIHILMNYLLGLQHGASKTEALEESLRINLQPVSVASITTAIGFLSLNFSEVPPFQHLGTIVAMGVIISFILSISFLPALIAVLPARIARAQREDHKMVSLGNYVVRHRRRLLWIMALIVVSLVINIPRNELNDVFLHWFDDSIQFRSDTDFVVDHLTGLYTTEYSLRAGDSGGVNDPIFLQEVDAFANWMRLQNGVRHVRTYTDILKRLNKNMHGDDPAMYKLPEERELAAQYLLLYEMSLPYGLDLNNQINVDKSSVRVTATTDALSTNEILALNESAGDWLAKNAPHVDALPASGAVVMFANIASRNIHAMLLGATLALVLISIILVAALRSAKIGFASLIPNLVPAAMGFGLWGIFVGEVGLSLSIVISMTLGIVIDDTVHFLSKYLRARREQGLAPDEAVRYAFVTVGRALAVTSIILVAGFLVLSFSSFENNADMGALTATIIALAIIVDFLLLPPLLMKIDGAHV